MAGRPADVVLLVDRLDRLATAMRIARRSRSIATQSVAVGLSLSIVAMAVAAAGFLLPAAGALLQEGIDIAVILNALRALGAGEGADRAGNQEPRFAHRQVESPLGAGLP